MDHGLLLKIPTRLTIHKTICPRTLVFLTRDCLNVNAGCGNKNKHDISRRARSTGKLPLWMDGHKGGVGATKG